MSENIPGWTSYRIRLTGGLPYTPPTAYAPEPRWHSVLAFIVGLAVLVGIAWCGR